MGKLFGVGTVKFVSNILGQKNQFLKRKKKYLLQFIYKARPKRTTSALQFKSSFKGFGRKFLTRIKHGLAQLNQNSVWFCVWIV